MKSRTNRHFPYDIEDHPGMLYLSTLCGAYILQVDSLVTNETTQECVVFS